ncbi:A/G-specific adenine glycosylase [Acidobacteria bacterium AB60]|nr:A/G-specific adenine glycosylase [Acidobacteria bacterium AB60]
MASRLRAETTPQNLQDQLSGWYAAHRRDLPWRRTRNPYFIWISEIMLQQTRVAVVIDRYQAFVSRFPTVQALAEAGEHDVLALWSGLGYYRRARMLHQAAQFVVRNLDGQLPRTAAELLQLPGVGGYTAAAIASIAYGEPVAVVDGNVERVICRLAGWDEAEPKGSSAHRRRIEQMASRLLDRTHPGEWNQAMMELGATVCLPRNPQCLVCPVASGCQTRGEHKTQPRARMLTREVAHAVVERRGAILLERRPAAETVMPGMWQLPLLRPAEPPRDPPLLTVRHAIMQVNYRVHLHAVAPADINRLTIAGGERRWCAKTDLAGLPLTGLARKVLTKLGKLTTHAPAARPRRLRSTP